MERSLQDSDIEEIMERMVQEHGEENVRFELKSKSGHDGTTIPTTKVRFLLYLNYVHNFK